MTHRIRIANAGGYWGDDPSVLRRQLEGGELDYITIDFLAEITMSILQRQQARDPKLGYAVDFLDQMRECLPLIVGKDVKVITNAGGANPLALGRRIIELAKSMDLPLTVGVVSGDDIMPELDALAAAGEPLANMETGRPLDDIRDRMVSANVYLGAEPVVKALNAGCQVIVTGRVTDTGISLAPMIHEFEWADDAWNRLASGIVAAHILECGAQSSGGNITDWREVKSFHDIGYPIVEMGRDGTFIVTKHPRTGGLVSEKTVKEQLVYEMGDPKAYVSPDVVARFDTIRLEDLGRNRVRISGAKGAPLPEKLKVSMAYLDGWKASGSILICGPDAHLKAETLAKVFWKRLGHKYLDTSTSVVGGGSVWPEAAGRARTDEVLLRLAVRDRDRGKVQDFGVLLPALILSGPSGLAVTGGRPKPSEVVAYWPALIGRGHVTCKVQVLRTYGKGRSFSLDHDALAPPRRTAPPEIPCPRIPEHRKWSRTLRRVKLRRLCYARSGDKGDMCNIGVLARSADIYAWLHGTLTPRVVKTFFKGIVAGRVRRFDLPCIEGFNFTMEKALGGGGTVSLRLDPQGKTLSQALLEMEIEAPANIIPKQ